MLNIHASMPADIKATLPGPEAVMGQTISVDGARWRRALSERNLPPVSGKLAHSDRITVNRQDVFTYGDQKITTDNAFQLLYYSMAWGLGLGVGAIDQQRQG